VTPAHLTPSKIFSGFPSGFTPPPPPAGYTVAKFEDFLGTSLSALGYGAGSGINAEGALWVPSHVTVGGSIASINAWQDPTVVGTYGITSTMLANVDNWVAGQFGVGITPPIGSTASWRILIAMRADQLAGLTDLALTTGLSTWPPEIDIVEANANSINSATLHYGSGPPTPPGFYPYFQTSCDLTQWNIWGVQVTPSTISFLNQTTPTGSLSTWASQSNPSPSGAHSFAQSQYLALQLQTNDPIYSSGTPNFPVKSPSITESNPIRQQMDWVQICTMA
jgi:hypothetical protein